MPSTRSQNRVPTTLLVLYLLLFTVCAISPYDRSVWLAENLPIMIVVAAIAVIHKYYTFTTPSYLLMACLIYLHTIGGHFTFERVPFDWVSQLFGFSRNHYDRMAHFSVGLYAYPIAEVLFRKTLVRSRWILFLFPIFTIFTVAGAYEIFEWLYAVSADASAGIAVLGSQGDIWDAQKDILADSLGSLAAMALFGMVHRRDLSRLAQAL